MIFDKTEKNLPICNLSQKTNEMKNIIQMSSHFYLFFQEKMAFQVWKIKIIIF